MKNVTSSLTAQSLWLPITYCRSLRICDHDPIKTVTACKESPKYVEWRKASPAVLIDYQYDLAYRLEEIEIKLRNTGQDIDNIYNTLVHASQNLRTKLSTRIDQTPIPSLLVTGS